MADAPRTWWLSASEAWKLSLTRLDSDYTADAVKHAIESQTCSKAGCCLQASFFDWVGQEEKLGKITFDVKGQGLPTLHGGHARGQSNIVPFPTSRRKAQIQETALTGACEAHANA